MTDRPILRLKNPPPSAPRAELAVRWKCKPCGALFEVSGRLQADEVVRCPVCNARLGRAIQFRIADGSVRARMA